MEIQEFNQILTKYIEEHKGDWIALHDAHDTSLSSTIENNGLCVSHKPYGGKIRHYKDEKGNIDLDHAFMATMHTLKPDQPSLPTSSAPVCPIIINIPKELADIAHILPGQEDAHHALSGYGYETKPEPGQLRGDIKYQATPEGANLRMLPFYLIAGHFDMKTGTFVENPKHFSKLPKEAQNKIIEITKIQYLNHQQKLANQNQPQ